MTLRFHKGWTGVRKLANVLPGDTTLFGPLCFSENQLEKVSKKKKKNENKNVFLNRG